MQNRGAGVKVCIYNDNFAVSSDTLKPIAAMFTSTLGRDAVEVTHVNAESIKAGALQGADIFVMPGGKGSRFYRAALRDDGNAAIMKFVAEGGSYLGICAGAYYACEHTDYIPGDYVQGFHHANDIGFFPGVGRGPASFIPTPARVAVGSESFRLHYNKGPMFVLRQDADPRYVQVLAHYDDIVFPQQTDNRAMAMVRCRYGRGQALLCGFHPERVPPASGWDWLPWPKGKAVRTHTDLWPVIVELLKTPRREVSMETRLPPAMRSVGWNFLRSFF